MPAWLEANGATIAVGLLLAAVVAVVIRKMISDRKKGKTSCGSDCGACGAAGLCHAKKDSADGKGGKK